MKIGLVSDVHAAPAPLAEAITVFRERDVDRIICAGDIAGYNDELTPTIDLLVDNGVDCIIGNHDEAWLSKHPELADSRDYRFLQGLPTRIELETAGVSVYIVHAEPPDATHEGIKLLDIEEQLIAERMTEWEHKLADFAADVLVVGHTHQVYAERIGDTLVVNPGSSAYNHSCMVIDLPSCEIDTCALSGKTIKRVWNWGMQVRGGA